ncbi:MAG: hypothetical protein A2X61_12000 [Ignavibacteria bacterium GWB2_35_12]|nr:MAG: hypothetical protein A2X61_12000 [Ignavibacteria bacterium GWB2_35_12]
MKKNFLFVTLLLSIAAIDLCAQVQPYYINNRGDTVYYDSPPPDSTYIHNELIIKFKPESLNLNLLCFNYPISDSELSIIMAQRFYVDDLIADTTLLSDIKSFGGDTLRRITYANPCSDTLSITRHGDTLLINDYLWMTLHINNDTSVIIGKAILDSAYFDKIEMTEPNYIYNEYDIDVTDPYFFEQKSLQINLIHVQRAWDYTMSNWGIRVGIIDDGIFYCHEDFGSGYGDNYKVAGGWNFVENIKDISFDATHGTPVAGIIGAITDNEKGVAGIAGGWDPYNIGCRLYGYRVHLTTESIVAAIRRASSGAIFYTVPDPNGIHKIVSFGDSVHIINISLGGPYSQILEAAVNYAYEHGVSLVAARGNEGIEQDYMGWRCIYYPACFENEWVTSVGAGNHDKIRTEYSNHGNGMDLIAPGGYCSDWVKEHFPQSIIIKTTLSFWERGRFDDYDCFAGTSASSPHVAGVIALLRSYAIEYQWLGAIEPVDFEGIIKASCLQNPYYGEFYEEETGWGHLQADNLFNMIADGYIMTLIHDENPNYMNYGDWSNWEWRAFIKDADLKNFPKPLRTGFYYVRHRDITSTIHLPENVWTIDNDHNLYVWGRKEFGLNSGWSILGPYNYQTRYTQVTSGTGGNGLVDGIIHNHSLDVSVRNYQYDVFWFNPRTWELIYMGHYPPYNQLGFNIGVFGKQGPNNKKSSVEKQSNKNSYLYSSISPNPVKDKTKIFFTLSKSTFVSIDIYDIFGNNIYKSYPMFLNTGSFSKEIDLSTIDNGIYFCKISQGELIKTIKIIKIK